MAIEFKSWNEFNEWAIKMYDEFIKHRNRYRVFTDRYCYTFVIDTKNNYKSGWSKRIVGDTWDDRIGTGIAFARLKGIDIPKVRKMEKVSFGSLKPGALFNIYENRTYVEYCLVGYDYINASYIATNVQTKKLRQFQYNANRKVFVSEEF